MSQAPRPKPAVPLLPCRTDLFAVRAVPGTTSVWPDSATPPCRNGGGGDRLAFCPSVVGHHAFPAVSAQMS